MREGRESGRGRRGEESHQFTLDVPGEDTNMQLEDKKKRLEELGSEIFPPKKTFTRQSDRPAQ